jgi:hypothetical protein
VFDLIRSHRTNAVAVLCAFDLLEVNGEDVRGEPIEDRKRRLAGLLRLAHDGIAIKEHFSGDGAVPAHLRARLRGHRLETPRLAVPRRMVGAWLKVKNPAAPPVKREAEEDWR